MDCIFCKIAKKEIPSKFVFEDDTVMAIMDINPLCDGHILIIPKEHYATIFDAPKDILYHMVEVAKEITPKIYEKLGYQGCTYSINYGDKQEIKHLHMHVMPDFKESPKHSVEEIYDKLMS